MTVQEAAAPAQPAPRTRKGIVLALVCLSHGTNHIQTGVLNVMYPLLRQEFGFGYMGIGLLETVHQTVGSFLHLTYGFLSRFAGRGLLLGLGNIVASTGVIVTGFSTAYPHLMAGASIRSIGSSAQHPVGAAALAHHFEDNRARILGFHQSTGNIGSLLAPILASTLLLVTGWRQILWLVALPSLTMGFAYLLLRDSMKPQAAGTTGRARAGLGDYRTVLKDRNMRFLALAMLAGAAGRGTNVLSTYLTTYLVDRYGIDVSRAGIFFAALMVGAIIGPVCVGWLADRWSHRLATQLSLVVAALLTFAIVLQPSASWLLGVHLALTGAFTYARGPLVETLFLKSTDKATLDVLLSFYYAVAFIAGPLWTMVAGVVIDRFGFTAALAMVSGSYLVAMALLSFVDFGKRD